MILALLHSHLHDRQPQRVIGVHVPFAAAGGLLGVVALKKTMEGQHQQAILGAFAAALGAADGPHFPAPFLSAKEAIAINGLSGINRRIYLKQTDHSDGIATSMRVTKRAGPARGDTLESAKVDVVRRAQC